MVAKRPSLAKSAQKLIDESDRERAAKKRNPFTDVAPRSSKQKKPPPKTDPPYEEQTAEFDPTMPNPFGIDASGPSELGAMSEADWVKASGWTPLEMLTHCYRNGFQRMEHRISAAKAVLEYSHRKLPDKLEVEVGGKIGVRSLDAAALSKLSDKELAQLALILEKTGG